MENTKPFEENVKDLFKTIDEQFPGVAEGLRVLNMSYSEYMTILQNSQPPSSSVTNGTTLR